MCKQLTNLNSAFDFFRFEAQFKEPSRLFWPFSCDHFGSKRRVSIGTIEDKSKERERERERVATLAQGAYDVFSIDRDLEVSSGGSGGKGRSCAVRP